ncbi:MAG: lipoyl synthase, partial [Burkholderia sp.]|nr:lipoyl synthase [Burkholderia sp.]
MAAALERPSLTALGQPGARSRDKLARIPVRVEPAAGAALPKPPWLRARPMMSAAVAEMAAVLREHRLHSVCEEAMCP